MIEYYIQKLPDGSHEIAKFDDSAAPTAIYTVKGKSCDCPGGSRRGTCKHIKMVADWRPGYFYIDKNLFPLDSLDHENVIATGRLNTK